MRYVLLALASVFLSGCTESDSAILTQCEKGITESLASPASYKRLSVTADSQTIEPRLIEQHFRKKYADVQDVVPTMMETTKMELDSGIEYSLETVFLGYEATNRLGVKLQNKVKCEFLKRGKEEEPAAPQDLLFNSKSWSSWRDS